jgi:hypothetical protein
MRAPEAARKGSRFSTTIRTSMNTSRFAALGCSALVGSTLLICCGSDEDDDQGMTPNVAGAAGFVTHQGGDSSGGRASPSGGAHDQPNGGSPASAGGGAGAVELSNGGGGGGPDLPFGGEQLELCARLTGLSSHSLLLSNAYLASAFTDCRVSALMPRRAPLGTFRSELNVFNLTFWGCQGAPVETFGLVYMTPPLSAGDAAILIDMYLQAAQAELKLSPLEATEMRAALERLAKRVVVDPSLEPSSSICDQGSGGAGGAGGAGGDTSETTAGAGGAGGLGGAGVVP